MVSLSKSFAALFSILAPIPWLAACYRSHRSTDSEKGVSKCNVYATINFQHATCTGCTSLTLPDGGRCQWNAGASTAAKRCRRSNMANTLYPGLVGEPHRCPVIANYEGFADSYQEFMVGRRFEAWKRDGGGQLHFLWWGDGGNQYLKAATASPTVLADAVGDPRMVHYWYDPDYLQLAKFLSTKSKLFTPHALNATAVTNLAQAANLNGDDVWNLVNNLKIKRGNGLACAKNFLSWLVLHRSGGQFLDTSVELWKSEATTSHAENDAEAFKKALSEPVEHATFPLSQLSSRYRKGSSSKPNIFEIADPWASLSKRFNKFPVFFNQTVEHTMLGNPQLYATVALQPSADIPMPQPELMLPSLDVWAIKAPRRDASLRTISAEFFSRASRYGLVDGTESNTTFPMQLFGRAWELGVLMEMITEADARTFQVALTSNRKTTLGNHFDMRAVCLKSLSMMSLHVGLAKASFVTYPNLGQVGNTRKRKREPSAPQKTVQRVWQRHVIYPATDLSVALPTVAEWRIVKYYRQTHVA